MQFAKVLTPVRFREELTYLIPDGMDLASGQWVRIPMGSRECVGMVVEISDEQPRIESAKMKEIAEKIALAPVPKRQIDFWRSLADYYMCSTADVIKAACPASLQKQAEVHARKKSKESTATCESLPELSEAQKIAYEEIQSAFAEGKSALLHGVTGSGKTEIYMHATRETLDKGRTVLYLVPEIAMSAQLQERLAKVFGERLLVFHSKQSAAQRKRVYDRLSEAKEPFAVLGTRSSIFLPFNDLGLVIVDEEHDTSYKQEEPSPRYNGRDAAMLLASHFGAKVLLGSATPSLESLFNAGSGKLRTIPLTQKYFDGACEPDVVLLDTIRAKRNGDMEGAFSKHLLAEIAKAVEAGGQALVFRSRRAYSTMVQCSACGEIPACPKCGVPLTYHKFDERLECHYCGYHRKFDSACGKCGSVETMQPVGAGTERLEEELSEHFPSYRIERFDSDTTQSKVQAERILSDFAKGKIDILVGTQMITKGFDFDGLSLVAVIAADSLLALQDFRADERALQLLRQFRGRAGRRGRKGMMFIQTSQPKHPVFQRLIGDVANEGTAVQESLDERKNFKFPPFVRLVLITVRDRSEGELWHVSREIVEILGKCGAKEFDKVEGEKETQFWVKLPRSASSARIKQELAVRLDALELRFKRKPQIIVDVDPL